MADRQEEPSEVEELTHLPNVLDASLSAQDYLTAKKVLDYRIKNNSMQIAESAEFNAVYNILEENCTPELPLEEYNPIDESLSFLDIKNVSMEIEGVGLFPSLNSFAGNNVHVLLVTRKATAYCTQIPEKLSFYKMYLSKKKNTTTFSAEDNLEICLKENKETINLFTEIEPVTHTMKGEASTVITYFDVDQHHQESSILESDTNKAEQLRS